MNTSSIRSSATAFCVAAVSAAAFADTVMTEPVALSGVSYYQSRDTQKVHVSYTLSNQDDEPAYVVMDVLTNGVSIGLDKIKTFGDSATVSQLDGAPVAVGTHEIVWDARKDWRGNLSTNAQVQLTAFYTNRFDIYMVVDLSGGPTATHYPVTYTTIEPDPDSDYSCISNKLYFKRVNAGTFRMGAPADSPRTVTLTKPFFAGVYPVTVAQYALVTGDATKTVDAGYRPATDPTLVPATSVMWTEIVGDPSIANWPTSSRVAEDSFMGRLRAKTGLGGFHLPTEAQWEYTCRAGTETDWNNGTDCANRSAGPELVDPNLDLLGWYNQNYGGKIHRVGLKQPNAWGFYDFHGSSDWKWCLDLAGGRSTADSTDPVGGTSGTQRIVKGGGYGQRAAWARSGIYSNESPTNRRSFRAFFNIRDYLGD